MTRDEKVGVESEDLAAQAHIFAVPVTRGT